MFRKIVEIIKAAFKNDIHPSSTAHGQEIKLTISTATTEHYVERFIADGIEVSRLNLGGYQSPSGGYVNWTRYEVKGKNAATNRKNTRRYAVRSESALASIAAADGLLEPYEIRVMPNDAPTDKQIEYLHSWNVEVPVGAVKEDVSAILSRLEDSYSVVAEERISPSKSVERIRPLDGPSEEFAQYADAMGVLFSKYIGKDALFDRTVSGLDRREKAAFFAYCVLCTHDQKPIGDLRSSKYAERIYVFADMAASDDAVMRSINGRTAYDYMKPHKGSAAYKAVANYFGIK